MNIGIIGLGTMGSGITQVAATSGCAVKLYDTNKQALEKSEVALEKVLSRLIEKGKINESEKSRIQKNITYVESLKDLSDSNLTIEAIIENLEIKKNLFSELEGYVSNDCIIASNTSSLSITSIAASLKQPERFIGIHFFNPAPLMQLVEVIPAIQTSKSVLEKSVQIITDWKKTVAVAKDTPGFIVNRVARPFYGEPLRIYEEGIVGLPAGQAGFETIDWSLKTLGGFKMGPFELMDFIGNDVNYAVTESVFETFYYDLRYRPSFTQKRMVEAGYLGLKSGKGFYNYDKNGNVIPTPSNRGKESLDKELAQQIYHRVLVMLINEAADALFWNIASAKDIDNAMTKGVNYPKGLLAWADEKGIDWCVTKMDELYNEYHEDRYRCSPLLRKMKREHKTFF